MQNDTERQVLNWALAGRTGASSKCMAAHLMGLDSDKSYPSDTGDFKRCLGLLDAAPALRTRLHQMSKVSKQWAALVDNWGEIERRVRADDKTAYDLMKSVLNPIEDADPNIFRVGPGATIHFGR